MSPLDTKICSKTCPENYVSDDDTKKCIKEVDSSSCDSSCEKCFGTTALSCSSCKPPLM